jgi:hypothetical protein
MTADQVLAVVSKYEKLFGDLPGVRFPADKKGPDYLEAQKHLVWMFAQTKAYATTDVEKAMRWLGFIQGVLWSKLGFSIDQMREENSAKVQPEKVTIIVNGKERDVGVSSISFEGVVRLAHPLTSHPEAYTVTFRHGHDGGSLIPGREIAVLEGMIFNVMQTGNA